jgi:UDP-4-amino-4,6-dideoxy-N-acetyl-beta-L-altrosamine transaminase
MIPYGRQSISEDDLAQVVKTLRSDYITQGPRVTEFETRLAGLTGSAHGVAFNSATSALHAACLALGLGPGDLAWTSPISFVASANCALYCGAEIDFVDIDLATFNMSVEGLAAKLEQAERDGRLPKIVIPVHMAGQSCDMAEIGVLAEKYGFRVIEDASHAVGGSYRNGSVGDCAHSDITVFSFHPVKIITSGEGGMAMTQDDRLAELLRLYCSHGITRDPALMRDPDQAPWHYEQIALGYNYRMTDIQAALGASQCNRLVEFVERRNALARRYEELLAHLPVERPDVRDDRTSAFHLYAIRLDPALDRRAVFERMRADGIGVNVHYIPIYHQPYYRDLGFAGDYCPVAERYYRSAISIPLFYDLTEAEQETVIASLAGAIAAA